jgi:release factor glutamine methyltransferase
MLTQTRTIATERLALAARLRAAGIDSADADARLLITHTLGIDRTRLLADGERTLDATELKAIDALAQRRSLHEPVARILGEKEFWSLPLTVTPDVLVPRPETETVVEAALDFVVRGGLRLEKLRLLDIGTGSGALLLALLRELPNAGGIGTDISAAAVAVAHLNAGRNDLAGRCTFVACNVATGLQGPFDLIVSNPPYVTRGDIETLAPEVRNFDPSIALDGGTDGLDFYRAIAGEARRLLAPAGGMIVELGMGQEGAIRTLFTKSGLTPGDARNDLAGIPRALSATIAS